MQYFDNSNEIANFSAHILCEWGENDGRKSRQAPDQPSSSPVSTYVVGGSFAAAAVQPGYLRRSIVCSLFLLNIIVHNLNLG